MNSLTSPVAATNVPAFAGRNASDKVRFGECGRYAAFAVHTRFDAVTWMVADAERTDDLGFASIIRQEPSFDAAVRGLH